MRACILFAIVAGLVAQDQGDSVKREPPAGHTRLWDRIFPYEPTYFLCEPILGGDRPCNAKFQLSMAVQVIGAPGKPAKSADDKPDGFYIGYSQASFWDLESDAKPFFDSRYRPVFF